MIPWLKEIKVDDNTPDTWEVTIAPASLRALIAIAEAAQELFFHIQEGQPPWTCATGKAVQDAERVP